MVALLEPAFIGDDDWDPAEARWRAAIGSLRASSGEGQTGAFRQMPMATGVRPPPRGPVAWDFRDDLLGTTLTTGTGFASSDLARLGAPVILIRGGHSAARFGLAARQLVHVCPRGRARLPGSAPPRAAVP